MNEVYSEGFWITIGGLVVGFLGLTIRYCLKSKCDEVSCFCIRIHRNIQAEEDIAELEMENGVYGKTDGSNK
jgi:hypothetical protein